jgi:hypothetical protein
MPKSLPCLLCLLLAGFSAPLFALSHFRSMRDHKRKKVEAGTWGQGYDLRFI